MTQSLFTDEMPKPFADYPPTWAYLLALVLGLVPFSGIIAAPLLARRWPSPSWRWGLLTSALSALALFVTYVQQSGPLVGAVETVTSPALLFVVALSCLLAWLVARARLRA
jgi:uncharacterized membrane protein HdeD (DUF308 family)